ncbi:probable inactive ATP-dependent zinc metalloprotease FTSHI 4, chloroplastic [Magnolia sinica]|uniref:probable inactive ATP-dependent zinc metalloprotease FTSHI 4, chloroplastic n=1 Tax=Magnolia sinica TaxID=86752 RepID=UPI002658415B|nr:probable inactive ATP-dependent zinc metalloprotease FTSHI 4, chloroplastic [Magnolia sinica]
MCFTNSTVYTCSQSTHLQQKGTFETSQEDSTEILEELKLRLAYREAAVAVLACYNPNPHRPCTETNIRSIRSKPNMRYAETPGSSPFGCISQSNYHCEEIALKLQLGFFLI